jgi:predicted transcriptional regulator
MGVRLESNKGVDTLKTLAKLAGITRDALYKVSVILATAVIHSKNAKLNKQIEKLRNGDAGVSISSAHEKLQELVGKKKTKKSVIAKPKQRSTKSAPSPVEPSKNIAGQAYRDGHISIAHHLPFHRIVDPVGHRS